MNALDLRRIEDWSLLSGANVEIRFQGRSVCAGMVDAVTEDGRILWILAPGHSRKLYERDESYEAWAAEDRTGFHYHITSTGPKAATSPAEAQRRNPPHRME